VTLDVRARETDLFSAFAKPCGMMRRTIFNVKPGPIMGQVPPALMKNWANEEDWNKLCGFFLLDGPEEESRDANV
jgi:hypothetical protein